MKIAERRFDDDGKLIIKRAYDTTHDLRQARMLRDSGVGQTGDNRVVARIPGWMVWEWCKEAGVAWSDVPARKEVMKKKLLSGEAQKLRVWEGTY